MAMSSQGRDLARRYIQQALELGDGEWLVGRQSAPSRPETRSEGADEAREVSPLEPRSLAVLDQEASTCTRCRLAEGRAQVVFGSGPPRADVMFIGEGPGAEEDRQGLPFVGPAGKLLTRIIQSVDLKREAVYIANIIKCRPPQNRDPLTDEAAACRPWLDGQIATVDPKIIVALGRVAAQYLLGTSDALSKLRGAVHEWRGRKVIVTYHPAALLRNPNWKRPAWEDMQAFMRTYQALTRDHG
jgi:DNA polymerase